MSKKFNDIRGILFDFDGTLIEIVPKWFTPMQEAFKKIIGDVPEDIIINNMAKFFREMPNKPSRTFMIRVLYSIGRSGGLSRLQSLRFIKIAGNGFKTSRFINIPFNGVPELFQRLLKRNIKIGVVTSASKKEMERAVTELSFLKGIPIVTRDDVNELKPSPEPILKGLELIGTNPSNTIYVGDFHTDIEAGKAAGTVTVAVINKHFEEFSRSGLSKYNPDLLIDDISKLDEYF